MKRLLLLVLAVAIGAPSAAFAMASPKAAQEPDADIFWDDTVNWDDSEESDVAWADDDDDDDDWDVAPEQKPEPEPVVATVPPPPAPSPSPPPPPPPEPEKKVILAIIPPQPQLKTMSSAESKSGITPEWDKFYRQLSDYCIRFPGECMDDSEYAAVPEIYKWEALRRFAYSPNAVSFALTPHVIHSHHEHIPTGQYASAQTLSAQALSDQTLDTEYKTIDFNRVYDTEWEEDGLKAVLDRKGSIYAKPWDNFEPFEFSLSKVDFEGPYLNEMEPYTEDLNPDEEGVVRFKKRVPTEGFDFVRPITRPTAKAITNQVVGIGHPQEGKVIVYRKTLLKPIVNVGVYSE